jgi:hypothetical protein
MTDASARPRWRRFVCHPVFPFLVYLVLTQLIRDNYPFSHYPMYSKPNSESLSFQYLADEKGNPLPIRWATGMSPSQLSKIHRNRMGKNSSEQAAALDVLQFVREQNHQRKGHELPEQIRLMEKHMAFTNGQLTESSRMLAQQTEKKEP